MRSLLVAAVAAAVAMFAADSYAYINLFISKEEMFNLVGIHRELFYIQEGVVNNYALNFVVKIPPYVSDLHFSWQSLTSPLDIDCGPRIPYVLRVKYDDDGVILPPQLNVSSEGFVPTEVQVFRIRLICTGYNSGQTEIQINLNINGPKTIRINFRRNKICLKGISAYQNESYPESLETSTGSFQIAAAAAFGLIAMTVFLVTLTKKCGKNQKERSETPLYTTAVYDGNRRVVVQLASETNATSSVKSDSYATIASFGKISPNVYATNDTCSLEESVKSQTRKLQSLWVSRSKIALLKLTEEGGFGRIYVGSLGDKIVNVKTVTGSASQDQIGQFLKEGLSLYRMLHKNVLPIMAINTDSLSQPLLVYQHAKKGNLKRYLRKCCCKERTKKTPSTQELVDMAIQILLGLMYLNGQRYLHDDVATRNCVLDSNLHVRVADSTLAKDLFPDDYYSLIDPTPRPIKWLPIETIRHNHYDAASLVWSFGVVLWELTAFSQQPYENVEKMKMCEYLKEGYRLHQMKGCPDRLYTIMMSCWSPVPSARPSFGQLLAYLQDLYATLGRYV